MTHDDAAMMSRLRRLLERADPLRKDLLRPGEQKAHGVRIGIVRHRIRA